MKQDLPIECLGSLPKLEPSKDALDISTQTQKELARKRLRAAGWDLDLYWQITNIYDRQNGFVDKDGYTWKYEYIDISNQDFARGVIVARKESGPGASEWFKVFDGRKVYRWEGNTLDPYEPREPGEPYQTPPWGTWERLREKHVNYLKDNLVKLICQGETVPSNIKERGEQGEKCIFHWTGFFSMCKHKLYRDEETGCTYDSYYENSVGVTELVEDGTVYSRVAEFFGEESILRFECQGRTLDVFLKRVHEE